MLFWDEFHGDPLLGWEWEGDRICKRWETLQYEICTMSGVDKSFVPDGSLYSKMDSSQLHNRKTSK